ncbi:carbohydrate-binding domain-containing protein [Clostridium grantii]|uniref:Uncharacterized protein n=1 Tax=Clostridium grantii DSM 8605 TaxID=1121316 RepID=A0A1M5V6L1_9CLOT|nr:carbohydrate-binding domain-containing protein [Clostridium grantii]SHH70851.1 protein of unknown function [Clostridium grantii DSM 8605]
MFILISGEAAILTNDTLVIQGEGILMVIGNNNEGISSDDDIIINSGIIKITAKDERITLKFKVILLIYVLVKTN